MARRRRALTISSEGEEDGRKERPTKKMRRDTDEFSQRKKRNKRQKRRRKRENKEERRERRQRRRLRKERRRIRRERRAPFLTCQHSLRIFLDCLAEAKQNPTDVYIKPTFGKQTKRDFKRFRRPSPYRVKILGIHNLSANQRDMVIVRDWVKELQTGPTTIVGNRFSGIRPLTVLKHEGDGLFSSVSERGLHLVLFRESANVFHALRFFYGMHLYNRVLMKYMHKYQELVAVGR